MSAGTRVDRRALLAARLERAAHRPDSGPAAPAQERVWLADQGDPDRTAYAIATAVAMTGPLDLPALTGSLDALVERHPALRTTFDADDGRLTQRIGPPYHVDIARVDAPGADPDRLADLFGDLARRRFDTEHGPLVRSTLVRVGADDHVLMLAVHHLVADGWSMGVLVRDLTALYSAAVDRTTPALPPLPMRHLDVATWQRDRAGRADGQADLAYWRDRIGTAPAVLDLPVDRRRPATRTSLGGRAPIHLDTATTTGLRALARDRGTTLFVTLLAGYHALLARSAGTDDVSVGVALAGRTSHRLENLVGLFANTVPIRADLSGRPGLAALVESLAPVVLGATAHQDFPVELAAADHAQGGQPLFQAGFTFAVAPPVPAEVAGLRVAALALDPGTAKFDLCLDLTEDEGGVTGWLEYSADLFDPATARRLARYYPAILAAGLADPDRPVADLDPLTPAERAALTATPQPTAYPRAATLAELFDRAAARAPDAAAVTYPSGSLTYRELATRADRLARTLRARGVRRGDRVALHLSRSPLMVTAMLAVIRAGAAYVPLDADAPPTRLAGVIADCGARLTLTEPDLADALVGAGGATLVVGTDTDDPDGPEPDGPDGPDDAAYVIYTSGSTGRPKGVVVPHRAVTRLVLGTDYVHLTESDRIAQASNAAFDAATFEVWGALLTGASLVGLPTRIALDPASLADAIREHRLTVLFLTTALFHEIARNRPDAFAPARTVLFGGEAADPECARAVLRHPPERLLHVYGPTESTTFATWYHVERVPDGATGVPIGGPVANTTSHVLDDRLAPVPPGLPGELYLGGDGLAWGYWDRPGLTAQRFVPDPFGTGGRLYRTGDRVRLDPDGRLEFLGRVDHQIKLRGFRVELGEVEAALAGHPDVTTAVAAVREDGGERRLVGYVVPVPGAEPGEVGPRVRADLRRSLPAYMVPAAVVALARLPHNPNGKVDRAALPAPVFDATTAAPRTPVQRLVATLWSQVLPAERIGVDDDFYDLGGDSLLAGQLAARLRRVTRMDPPLRDLLAATTVSRMAEVLERHEPVPGHLDRVATAVDRVASMSEAQIHTALTRRRPDARSR